MPHPQRSLESKSLILDAKVHAILNNPGRRAGVIHS